MTRWIAVASLSGAAIFLAAPPAMSEQRECPTGPVEYCYCIYENTLDELKEAQGNNFATIKQRVKAAKTALDKCLSRGTKDIEDNVKGT